MNALVSQHMRFWYISHCQATEAEARRDNILMQMKIQTKFRLSAGLDGLAWAFKEDICAYAIGNQISWAGAFLNIVLPIPPVKLMMSGLAQA